MRDLESKENQSNFYHIDIAIFLQKKYILFDYI